MTIVETLQSNVRQKYIIHSLTRLAHCHPFQPYGLSAFNLYKILIEKSNLQRFLRRARSACQVVGLQCRA